jgi:hypothetical protein
LRIYNQCGNNGYNFSVGSTPSTISLLAGATNIQTNLFDASNPTAKMSANAPNGCSPYNTIVYVQPPSSSLWLDSTDPYFAKVISSVTVPTGTTGNAARRIGITFKPDILEFGSGLSTAPKSLTIKVTWWTPGKVVDTSFGISIYPTSKIV